MKKTKAFVWATALFLAFVVCMHYVCLALMPVESREFGYWISYNKDASYEAISRNIGENTAVYMGSSEFHHGLGHKYNPSNLFMNSDVDLMCIGGAFSQCLSHAITMGAIGGELSKKKVALILSPTWFYAADNRKVSKFYLRYSKSLYEAMMNNEGLSSETRQRIAERVSNLMDGRNENEEKFDGLGYIMQGEKDRNKCAIMWLGHCIKRSFAGEDFSINEDVRNAGEVSEYGSLDFGALRLEAEECSKGRCTNDFNMKDSVYEKKFASKLESLKGKNKGKTFEGSMEFEDLQMFIDVCKEQGIEVLLILQPVNGKWYDYTGVSAEKRQGLYEDIWRIAKENQVELADLSGEEYTEDFFEDAVHPTEKGWVMINEKAYEFFRK